jgi:hypothetical protein
MIDLGIQLFLLVGQTVPAPAPQSVMEALREVEVTNNDRQRDGFQLSLTLGRRGAAMDFGLLSDDVFAPDHRVTIVAVIQGVPNVLINGIVTRHQVMPSNEPAQSRLRVTGEDTGLQLDYEDRNTTYRNMSDSAIVLEILRSYGDLIPMVTPTTDVPLEINRIVTQQRTDLAFVRELARRNDFVFYTEPSPAPGVSTAYWGPKNRPGLLPQPALTMNMGSWTNVEQLSFDFDALRAVTPKATIMEPMTGLTISIPVPNLLSPSLASRPAQPLRTRILRDTANLDAIQAALRLLSAASEGEDAVTGTGTVDTTRYGQALRSRRQVGVRGAGETNDGTYYVKQVTHRMRRGSYTQSFTLTRGGRGATSPMVRV